MFVCLGAWSMVLTLVFVFCVVFMVSFYLHDDIFYNKSVTVPSSIVSLCVSSSKRFILGSLIIFECLSLHRFSTITVIFNTVPHYCINLFMF